MKTAIIQVGIAPLYGAPDAHQVIIDEGLYGMEAEIIETGETFDKIRMEYGYEGYVHKEQLHLGAWPEGVKLRVLKSQIDILEEPKVTSVLLVTMPRGSVVQKAEAETPTGWIALRLADGRIGYSKQSFFTAYQPIEFGIPKGISEAQLRNNLVAAARLYEGTAYRWGGKSPQGIDCSGLTAMAYLLNGIIIYRDAAIRPGFPLHAIKQSQMQPGDLMFFKGHVAMYIGGERRLYIHSTAKAGSDGVDYNSLLPEDPLYRQDLAEGILAVGSVFGKENEN